ncbi:unnamed protein product [Rotaria sp. Silwood2]|nr:unnamed protein product [Rotaria sp. Silwood2]CAF2823716.1 unnamed protein product [Rotaria sp. Silwood2]CAF4397329.1 unnamed protein product [Rotaria sp. Silwood2]CAF4543016.1 unnamed protein product [Rotaria sp. Silwood2]
MMLMGTSCMARTTVHQGEVNGPLHHLINKRSDCTCFDLCAADCRRAFPLQQYDYDTSLSDNCDYCCPADCWHSFYCGCCNG